ncbi:hypothetical protein [Mycobacterium nebraskense]|uniref:hypothetical protein n=1 Tax=Mycobacterium nebraskense TaxID=244292 RepID=UPI0023F000AF|nr:hypothetical protein [Mycobacterium nebraskense]MBI2692771.1 hypothetical protein [Mycobacterium nebraskense]
MRALPVFPSIESAWIGTLEVVHGETDGRLHHVVVAVDRPGTPDPTVIAVNDALLHRHDRHSVARVASTVFPSSSYAAPAFEYRPGMPADQLSILDTAAADLYGRYRRMLPWLQTFAGNEHGTYFGRLVSWPGKDGDGYNQLAKRVRQLRACRDNGRGTFNAADMTTDDPVDGVQAAGLREYDATHDTRVRAFPCLVHLDVSVLRHRLHMVALYRDWHLISKAYGNLIGLTRLQHFLAQQTGYEVGELMVHATAASTERRPYTKRAVTDLLKQARRDMQASGTARPTSDLDAAGRVTGVQDGNRVVLAGDGHR